MAEFLLEASRDARRQRVQADRPRGEAQRKEAEAQQDKRQQAARKAHQAPAEPADAEDRATWSARRGPSQSASMVFSASRAFAFVALSKR